MRFNRFYFSIINKVRKQQVLKSRPLFTVKSKIYQFNDFIGNNTYPQVKDNLTPHQQYLIQTKSMERSFTGNLWAETSVGFYHCAVCKTRLFSFDQKLKTSLGYATFYDCIENRVLVVDEKAKFDIVNTVKDPWLNKQIERSKRCECAQCKSNIGSILFDGGYPTYVRFLINSELLKFEEIEDFSDPNIKKKQRLRAYKERLDRRI